MQMFAQQPPNAAGGNQALRTEAAETSRRGTDKLAGPGGRSAACTPALARTAPHAATLPDGAPQELPGRPVRRGPGWQCWLATS